MFVTSNPAEKEFTTRKLFTQADIQGHFRIIHMETYESNLFILEGNFYNQIIHNLNTAEKGMLWLHWIEVHKAS